VENVGVDEVGEVGDAPEQAAAKTQKPITTYRMCCPQRDSVSEARFNKWLRLDGLSYSSTPIGADGGPQRSSDEMSPLSWDFTHKNGAPGRTRTFRPPA